MDKQQLNNLINQHGAIVWLGKCHDCGCQLDITATRQPEGIEIQGGAVYIPKHDDFYGKCDRCHTKHKELSNYQDCEVYSRVVGYLRPVNQWNPGKQAEFKDRHDFKL